MTSIRIDEEKPVLTQNGYRNGVSKNGHSNGSLRIANPDVAIEIVRPNAPANLHPAAHQRTARTTARSGRGRSGLLGSQLGPQFPSESCLHAGWSPAISMKSGGRMSASVLGSRNHQPLR